MNTETHPVVVGPIESTFMPLVYKGLRILDGDMAGVVLTASGELAHEIDSLSNMAFEVVNEAGRTLRFQPTEKLIAMRIYLYANRPNRRTTCLSKLKP